MRLGVLTTSYPRSQTDLAGCFVAELSRALSRGGDDVSVLAAAPACASGADRDAGVRVRGLRYALRPRLFYDGGAPDALATSRAALLVQAPAFSLRLAAAAAVAARAQRWQAVVAHWLTPSALAGALVAPSLPQLHIAHGSDVQLLSRLPAAGGALLLARLAAAPRARLVLAAEALRAPLAALAAGAGARAPRYVEAARVERMGVAPAASPPPGALARVRARLGVAPEQKLVLCLARLVELKGVDVAIEAARGARYALVIAGEGPQRAALEAAARRLGVGARFVGLVSGRAKEHLLAAADLLVAPSRRDAAPVTLLEALDAGVPVVASDVGDNRALLGAEAVVPAGDSAALARAIAAQLASTPDAAALRARAAPYRWAGVARRIRALLG